MSQADDPLFPAPERIQAQADHVRPTQPIALIGLMGVGKTFLGRRLARRLHLPFRDSDEEVEQAAGTSIPEIFARHGEPYFRDGERRVIARLIGCGPMVLSTGGGAFMDAQTRALLLEKSAVVWLDARIDTILERVGRRNNRPLLQQGDPEETLARLMGERRPAYAQAHIHVRVDDGGGDPVDAIVAGLKGLS